MPGGTEGSLFRLLGPERQKWPAQLDFVGEIQAESVACLSS